MTVGRLADGIRRRRRYRKVRATRGTVLRELNVAGTPLLLADYEGSVAVEVVAGEIGDGAYDFSAVKVRPGDVILDLGAHIGVVATYLAKRFPDATIHAFEPCPPVFALLEENVHRNRVRNVVAHNEAVAATAGHLELISHLASNSAGSTAYLGASDASGHDHFTVPAVSLDDIFERYGIQRCPLLKIDVEGAEYEVLHAASHLDRVAEIRGEFHENAYLRSRGCSMADLRAYCEGFVGTGHVRYTECFMQDP
jgi:FkbM family methyltransferase